jgi:hypothetical protein
MLRALTTDGRPMGKRVKRVCAERGCKRPRSGAYLRCAKHLRERRNARRIELLGGDRRLGATCLICGMGPYVRVGSHAFMLHGVTRAEYLRMFPGADMTHTDLKRDDGMIRSPGGTVILKPLRLVGPTTTRTVVEPTGCDRLAPGAACVVSVWSGGAEIDNGACEHVHELPIGSVRALRRFRSTTEGGCLRRAIRPDS